MKFKNKSPKTQIQEFIDGVLLYSLTPSSLTCINPFRPCIIVIRLAASQALDVLVHNLMSLLELKHLSPLGIYRFSGLAILVPYLMNLFLGLDILVNYLMSLF